MVFFGFVNLIKGVGNKKLEILKIDSTADLYVFNTKCNSKEFNIIIAEKQKLQTCYHFKRFILIDSIKESPKIKAGSRYDFIGFNEFTIDGVKVKNGGVLVKFIDNCESLSN